MGVGDSALIAPSRSSRSTSSLAAALASLALSDMPTKPLILCAIASQYAAILRHPSAATTRHRTSCPNSAGMQPGRIADDSHHPASADWACVLVKSPDPLQQTVHFAWLSARWVARSATVEFACFAP